MIIFADIYNEVILYVLQKIFKNRRTSINAFYSKTNFFNILYKKQQIFVDYFTYQRIRTQVFNYPKKYQNNFTYYIDLDNDLYEITVENHEPIIHNKITNYEQWLDVLGVELGGKKHDNNK